MAEADAKAHPPAPLAATIVAPDAVTGVISNQTPIAAPAPAVAPNVAATAAAPTVCSEHSGAFVRLGQLWQRRSHYSLVLATADAPDYRDALIAQLDALHPAARIDLTAGREGAGGLGGDLGSDVAGDSAGAAHALAADSPAAWLHALVQARAHGHDRVHVCLPLEQPRSDAWWQQANLLRERLADAFAGVQLLWLGEADVDAAAHQAPDLWNWREAVLVFTVTPALAMVPKLSAPHFDQTSEQPSPAVRERLAQIETYLAGQDDAGISAAHLLLEAAHAHERLGQWPQSLLAARRAAGLFDREGDATHAAHALAQFAEVTFRSGKPDEALRVLREQVIPVFERLGDARSIAMNMGRVADILQARGQLEEALRIRRDEVLPVFERLGDVRSKAVTVGKVADILRMRGQLDEALRIHREEELPVYERLGDVREKAVTMSQVAAILQTRGQLDEAQRIHCEDVLPMFERLGDVRAKAVVMGRVADIVQARGQLDEALRIRREEQVPVFERLGDVQAKAVCLFKIAQAHALQGRVNEARAILFDEVLPVLEAMGFAHEAQITRDQLAVWGDLAEPLRP